MSSILKWREKQADNAGPEGDLQAKCLSLRSESRGKEIWVTFARARRVESAAGPVQTRIAVIFTLCAILLR